MKLTIFLVLFSIFGATANSYSQSSRFNLKYKDATIKEVLDEIKTKSDLNFFFSNDDFNVNRKINLTTHNATIEEVLDQILKPNQSTQNIPTTGLHSGIYIIKLKADNLILTKKLIIK